MLSSYLGYQASMADKVSSSQSTRWGSREPHPVPRSSDLSRTSMSTLSSKRLGPSLPWRNLLYLIFVALWVTVALTIRKTYFRIEQRVYFPFELTPTARAPRDRRFYPEPHNSSEFEEKFAQLAEVVVYRYMKFHRAHRFDPNARKLIYTGEGHKNGFGDRFRGILHAYLLAVMSERVLLLAWSDPFPLSTVFESAQGTSVMYDPIIDGGKFPKQSFYKKRDHVTTADELPWCKCRLTTPEMLLSAHRAVVVTSEYTPSLNRLLHGLYDISDLPAPQRLIPIISEWNEISRAAGGDDAFYALVFRHLLRPSTALLERLAGMKKELRSIVPARLRQFGNGAFRGYVSVHARVGYGLGEDRSFSARFDLEKKGANLEMIAECLAKLASSEAEDADLTQPHVFYLASDTPQFAGIFRKHIQKVSPKATVLEIEGEKMHSNAMDKKSEVDKDRFILAGADLFYLSGGERLIGLPSGFANLARYFGEVPQKTIRVEDCVVLHGNPPSDED